MLRLKWIFFIFISLSATQAAHASQSCSDIFIKKIIKNMTTNYTKTQFLEFAEKGDIKKFKDALKQDNIDVNAKDQSGNTALFFATQRGHKDIVRELLKKKGIDVNAETTDGNTALLFAAQSGHTDIVRELLKKKNINVNARNTNGSTALILAARYGHTDIVRELLKKKNINVNAKIKDRNTALILAARNGHTDIVRELLKKKNINVNAKAEDRNTALILAAQKGHTEIALALLKRKNIYVNAKASNGNTALILAAQNGRTEIALALLRHSGIKANAKDSRGNTALILAAQNGHTDIIVELLKKKNIDVNAKDQSGNTALILAAQNDHTDIARELLKKQSIDVNATDWFENTALVIAARNGHIKIVIELLKHPKINVNAKNLRGSTALIAAAHKGHIDIIVEFLKKKNISVNAKDEDRNTALIIAAQNGHTDIIVELLKKKNINVNAKAEDRNTALIIAAQNGHTKIVIELLKHPKINVNEKDLRGNTALIAAAHKGHIDIIVELLKKKNINVNAKAENGNTALILAAQNGHTDIVRELLKKKNISVNAKAEDGNTALMLAIKEGHRDIVRELLKHEKTKVSNIPELNKLLFGHTNDISEIQSTLREITPLKPDLADIVYTPVYRRNMGLWLYWRTLQYGLVEQVKDSIHLMELVTGRDLSGVRDFSENRLGDLFELMRLASLKISKDQPHQELIDFWAKFDNELWHKKHSNKLAKFIELLNANHLLRNDFSKDDKNKVDFDSISITKTLEEILSTSTENIINKNNIVELTKKLETKLIESVSQRLDSSERTFTPDEYLNLTNKWGDLTPIWVLVARLSPHKSLLPILRDIFFSSLDGEFHRYKFEGLTKKQQELVSEQLSMLDASQREAWAKPQVIARMSSATEMSKTDMWAQAKRNIEETIDNNLEPHWKTLSELWLKDEANKKQDTDVGNPKMNEIDWIGLAKSHSGDVRKFFTTNGVESLRDQIKVIDILVKALKESLYNKADAQKITQLIRTLISISPVKTAETEQRQVIEDLNSIVKLFSEKSTEGKVKEALIVSVKTSDPRMLLIIGDAINCSSCQSYATGSVVRTLPGYVIDANVQALLSYEVRAGDFKNPRDYEEVKLWIERQSEEPVEISFDGNLRIVKFEKQVEGRRVSIASESLGYAYLRNILKLGSIKEDGKPAVFMEPDYAQLTANNQQMRAQHQELMSGLALEIGAETSGNILVKASRSPEGHYSDKSGGVKTGGYGVHVQEK